MLEKCPCLVLSRLVAVSAFTSISVWLLKVDSDGCPIFFGWTFFKCARKLDSKIAENIFESIKNGCWPCSTPISWFHLQIITFDSISSTNYVVISLNYIHLTISIYPIRKWYMETDPNRVAEPQRPQTVFTTFSHNSLEVHFVYTHQTTVCKKAVYTSNSCVGREKSRVSVRILSRTPVFPTFALLLLATLNNWNVLNLVQPLPCHTSWFRLDYCNMSKIGPVVAK